MADVTSPSAGPPQAGRRPLVGSARGHAGPGATRGADATYFEQRGRIEDYFDRTAAAAWARLTSDAPLGRIRATVRAGRERMRATILSWLPADLSGTRILDAGCGTGAFAVEAARRGAQVVAVDLSPTLVDLARQRLPADLSGSIDFRSCDLLDPALGRFDHVVMMDVLIHYDIRHAVRVVERLSRRTSTSIVFTFAPRTPLLAAMHTAGRLFPRGDRAPAIQPVAEAALRRCIAAEAGLAGWRAGRSERVAGGFYISQAVELAAT